MSRLPPTPLSERKQSLRSHSKAPQEFPSVEEEPQSEPSSENEDRTQYDLAEEGDTMEGPSGSGRVGRGKQSEHESLETTESTQSTPSPLMPIGMPTSAANGTITMTAADLLAFCQQMMNARGTQNSEQAPIDMKREIREYQRDVQASMDTKTVTTFDGTNYQVWKIGILADAEVIGATDILMKNQHTPPEGLEGLERECWVVRTKALYRCMLQSLLGRVRTTIESLEPDDAAALWEKIGVEYAVSLAEERMNIMKELATLQVKDKIITPENNTGRRRRGKKKDKEKDDNKEEPDLLATQPAAANAAIAFSATVDAMFKPWFLDTCASFNMTGEKQSLLQRTVYNGNLKINTADGGQGHVKGIGNLLLESEGGDITIRDVHWVPNLMSPQRRHLTAIRTAQSSIYKIVERVSEVDIHHESKAVYFTANSYEYANAMAVVDGTDQCTNQPEEAPTTKTLAEWHVDLGHIHAGAIIALAKNPLSGIRIKGPKTSFFCDICVKAGMMRKYSQTPCHEHCAPWNLFT
ncbi:hypothetical protein ACJ72_02724 [Emergomyces africanus]|uniref:Retrovirus-related Pol polyprotein from transposon TNT 1-94-like beta-barrel domain-containing protein n=1 Tax=Emergomyces africanus TaxID=1955775 RepID=A0A1B7P244_9EURO|nr:hypothetical protein ACJ72_02724 [Emergomyces africanus]